MKTVGFNSSFKSYNLISGLVQLLSLLTLNGFYSTTFAGVISAMKKSLLVNHLATFDSLLLVKEDIILCLANYVVEKDQDLQNSTLRGDGGGVDEELFVSVA